MIRLDGDCLGKDISAVGAAMVSRKLDKARMNVKRLDAAHKIGGTKKTQRDSLAALAGRLGVVVFESEPGRPILEGGS